MDRLILLVESRIRGDVYVRFGGELPKTHRSNTAGRWMLSLPLEKLPKQCQTIFRMNRNQGMRSDEIASVLKLSVRTVENQLYRGLKLIRQSLDDYLTILILLFVDNLFK